MGLLDKIFRADKPASPADSEPGGTRFAEPDDDSSQEQRTRSALRRELIQVALRENMRRHAVPSDWLECRILPVIKSNHRTGYHVQLVVKQGQGSLLTYVPAFQSSLMAEIEKFDARAWDWLLSISWQFEGITSSTGPELPGANQWKAAAPGAGGAAPVVPAVATSAVAAAAAAASATAVPAAKAPADDDVMQDLQALFAIRDAALQQDQPDFEPTRPGFDEEEGEQQR